MLVILALIDEDVGSCEIRDGVEERVGIGNAAPQSVLDQESTEKLEFMPALGDTPMTLDVASHPPRVPSIYNSSISPHSSSIAASNSCRASFAASARPSSRR